MKKSVIAWYAALIVLLSTALAGAAVNVNINIGMPLPEVRLSAPPALAVISGTYVYVATDVNADLVFYQDNWYRPHSGKWYVSVNYNGPWKITATVPGPLVNLPQNYREVPPGHERMPYGHVKDNWRTWEKDRHWDRASAQEGRSEGRDHDKHEKKKHKKEKKKKKHDDDDDGDDHEHGREREGKRSKHDD